MTREELTARIRQCQAEYEQVDAIVNGAMLCNFVLHDLQLLWQAEDSAELSLAEASLQSGYTQDHLRRLASQDRVPHVRRGRRLYFQAGTLPRKPGGVDTPRVAQYDPVADARQVAAQRNRGGSHGT